ncbi:discoidin domain-containing receptor 2 isoform X2 [Planococcus citri]|uniref:discoidin domain-containing receptor 2 isoform X2 n=1 Tax=Planococcus citri TaxID=170843 RepID=UPI0031F83DC8
MIWSCFASVIAVLMLISSNGVTVTAIDFAQCTAALGMQSGKIKDEDISASSSFDSGNVGPQHGRIRTESHGGAWCPKQEATQEPKEWLEINLQQVHVISSVETQGRFGNGQGQEYAEAYQLEYWRPKLGKWKKYRNYKGEEVIAGNENTYLEAKRHLDPPIWASRIRFVPYSYHRRTVCMRVEVYGCPWSDGIVSYSMPQGDKRGDWEFYDATYDGYWNEELQRGLGQLTDGKVGPENFKMSYYDYEKSQGWVGWNNDTRNGQPVEIKFEFDRVREFTFVHIFTNNQFSKDVQVFSRAEIMFSTDDRPYIGNPITYTYMEDKVFENSRNVTIKLHRRVGRFVKLRLHFSNQWIMISEVIFDSDVAHGNFTFDVFPTNEITQNDVNEKERGSFHQHPEIPVSPAQQEDQAYMAIIIGVLMAVIILLAFAILLIIARHRQRKCFASPLTAKSALAENHPHISAGSSCGTYSGKDGTSSSSGLTHPLQKGASTHLVNRLIKIDDYQEPYQALRYAPYYSYSSVVMEMRDTLNKTAVHADSAYDYAVPETGTMPLLSPDIRDTPPSISSCNNSIIADKESLFTRSYSSDENKNKKSLNPQEILHALKRRLEHTTVPEFPRHRLRMLSRLGEGAFGRVYIAEADGIMEYGATSSLGKRLVAVKFLMQNASEKEKIDFHRDVRILAALEDVNIARVLGVCTSEEPLCVIMEYLEHGDLNEFLKTHVAAETTRSHPVGVKTLSFNCLLYMATQIASGMRYLESLNFVHRDLATRNCLVGKAYQIKISDFGTDNELYTSDYYKIDANTSLPVRWMAWESVFLGKYTTKSDVWSFAVTLWEILTLAREPPYQELTDTEVMQNLSHLHHENGLFVYLPRPPCTKDIFDLMLECWRKQEAERPTFREIHLFLQRKNLGYAPVS